MVPIHSLFRLTRLQSHQRTKSFGNLAAGGRVCAAGEGTKVWTRRCTHYACEYVYAKPVVGVRRSDPLRSEQQYSYDQWQLLQRRFGNRVPVSPYWAGVMKR